MFGAIAFSVQCSGQERFHYDAWQLRFKHDGLDDGRFHRSKREGWPAQMQTGSQAFGIIWHFVIFGLHHGAGLTFGLVWV